MKQTNAMPLSQYMVEVKIERKKMDGRETYSKWAKAIREAWERGTSVVGCANFICTMDEGVAEKNQ